MARVAGLGSWGPEFEPHWLLTPSWVVSACHPSEVGEMSTSILLERHSISGTATLPRNDSYLAAKLPYARTENLLVTFQDILHLPPQLGTSHAVGIVFIMNDSPRMTEHKRLAQDDGARMTRSG